MLSSLLSLLLNQSPLVYVVGVLATVWYLRTRSSRPANIPPVPVTPYPLLGHLPYLGTDPTVMFSKWRGAKGDIFSVFMGSKLVVVMNSYEVLREAFVKQADHFSDRPKSFLTEQYNILKASMGIVASSGPQWKENRAVSMGILKDLGMGKNWLAEKISEEVGIFLETLASLKGQPSNLKMVTNKSVCNVICAILIGRRFELDDPYFTSLIQINNENIILLNGTAIVHIFPWLFHLPGDLFKAKRILSNTAKLSELFSATFVDEAKKNAGGEGVDNFISSYLELMKEKEELGEHTNLSESELIQVLTDLFGAGSETTSTTLMWAFLFAVRYPDAQEKFYQEILDVTGPERRPTMLHKSKMNYVNAFIMETQRFGSIAPLSLSHDCNKTVEVAGYTIPKDTMVIPNLNEVLKDKKTWGDPDVFRPERFLDKDGKVFVPDEFIPFSIGRRYCMGEALAKMELFLFLTGVFQRFHIRPEDPNNLPSDDRVFGITCLPKPYNVRLVDRHEEN